MGPFCCLTSKMPPRLPLIRSLTQGVFPRPDTGRKNYFGTLIDLVDSVEQSKAADRLDHCLKALTDASLLFFDEIGFLQVTQSGGILLFQLINRRYGCASSVLTS